MFRPRVCRRSGWILRYARRMSVRTTGGSRAAAATAGDRGGDRQRRRALLRRQVLPAALRLRHRSVPAGLSATARLFGGDGGLAPLLSFGNPLGNFALMGPPAPSQPAPPRPESERRRRQAARSLQPARPAGQTFQRYSAQAILCVRVAPARRRWWTCSTSFLRPPIWRLPRRCAPAAAADGSVLPEPPRCTEAGGALARPARRQRHRLPTTWARRP